MENNSNNDPELLNIDDPPYLLKLKEYQEDLQLTEDQMEKQN